MQVGGVQVEAALWWQGMGCDGLSGWAAGQPLAHLDAQHGKAIDCLHVELKTAAQQARGRDIVGGGLMEHKCQSS